jgi:ATP-dependent protease HslVU (ClpYQ) peptidase subunit
LAGEAFKILTCIIGIEDGKGGVCIGGDGLASLDGGYLIGAGRTEKVWRQGGLLVGHSGAHRDGQIMRYAFKEPQRIEGQSVEEYLAAVFVPALWKFFSDHQRIERGDGSDDRLSLSSQFLLGVGGEVYLLDKCLSFERYSHGFAAIGQGQEVALGAMRASLRWEMLPEERVRLALEQAAFFCDGVGGEFLILKNQSV